MATDVLKALTEAGTRTVGNLNSLKVRTLAHGAKVDTADIDNFTLVELDFNADGERICRQLPTVSARSYLIATPEARYMGEELSKFYNAVGEFARIVYLDEGLRFETSAFELNAGITVVANGLKAHFNPATKKFILHDGTHMDYANADAQFVVVSNEEDMEYTNGFPQVRLEVL